MIDVSVGDFSMVHCDACHCIVYIISSKVLNVYSSMHCKVVCIKVLCIDAYQ